MRKFTNLFYIVIALLLSSGLLLAQESTVSKAELLSKIGVAPATQVNKTVVKPPSNSPKGNTAWLQGLWTPDFGQCDADLPTSTWTSISSPAAWQAYAGDFDNMSPYYYYVIESGSTHLLMIDVTNGAIIRDVGPVALGGLSVTGMACDRNTGTMYLYALDFNVESYLFTLDLNTAIPTLVGGLGLAGTENIIDMAIDGTGTMYAWGLDDNLYAVNTATGAGVLVGPVGVDLNYAQGGTWDPVGDIVYAAAYNNATSTPEMYSVNRTTGAFTFLEAMFEESDAMGFPNPLAAPAIDVLVASVDAPVSGMLGAAESVTITIYNIGTTTESNIPVSFALDGGTPVSEVFAGPIAPNSSASFTFFGTADCSVVGPHQIVACTGLGTDNVPSNDCFTHNFATLPTGDCQHTIELLDSYGDGWNGNTMDVLVNGNVVLDDITLPSGFGPAVFSFYVSTGDLVETVYSAVGGWPEENSYEFFDDLGTIITSSGPQAGGPPDINYTAVCAGCCDHSITLEDSYGDGWNGGYVDVYVDGNPVLTSLTLAGGFGPETTTFTACNGADIDVYYTAGGWPEENSYYVMDGAGNTIGNAPAQAGGPGDLLDLVGNCVTGITGCENTSMYPGAPVTVDATGLVTVISACNYAGEYAQLTNIQVGTYEFTMVDLGTGTFITLTDGPPTGANILASGPSPLQYTTTSTADLYIHFNLDAGCGTDFSCHETTAQLLPTGCENTSQYPGATITVDPTGLLTQITACNYAGEYSHLTGIVIGETYEFTFEDLGTGTFITVTDGPPTGANILASGVSPVSWTATFTGDVYVHWNLDSNCGTDFACHVSTVQCTSCSGGVTPPNDDCANAEIVVCNDVITASTTTATVDNAPTCGTTNTAPGVWYVFTGIGETVTVDMQGTIYDTKLTVYEGDCANLVCVWGNDDFYGLQSRVDWYSEVGVDYYILVHGYNNAVGDFTLNVGCTPAAATTWTGSYGDNVYTNTRNWDNGVPGTYTDVTVPGGLTSYPTVGRVNVCNDIYLGSDATATATLLDNGLLTVYGTATADRYYNDPTWHLVSSPISNGLAGMYNGMYLQWYEELMDTWHDIIPVTDPLIPVQGYALWVDAPWTASYVGNLNTGAQILPISAAGPDPYHWNLFGNPYPSGLDWDMVWPANPQIAGAVYYLEAATGNYLSYNGGMGGGSQYVPPMQGFFVSGLADGAPFALDNTMRVHNGGNMYYKSEFNNMIVLKAEGNGYTDRAYLRFDGTATEGFDSHYDAYKLFTWSNDLLPQFYTTGGDKLSINVLPEKEIVPAGFKAGTSGTYTISIDKVEGMSEVILEDLFTGTFTNLLEDPYTFNYNAGDVEARFVLHFGPLALPELSNVGYNIFSSGKDVYVYVPENIKGDIVIYNALGQIVKTAAINSPVNTIRLENTATYIVRVLSDDNVVTKKVFIE